MAAVFQQKATGLAAGLEHDEKRDAARMALRGFLERSVSLLFQSDGPVPWLREQQLNERLRYLTVGTIFNV